MTSIETRLEILDKLLLLHADALGNDYGPYRNHCYRLYHFCQTLGTHDPEDLQKVMIAAAFHDIGIWTEQTLDYLAPSASRAASWLADNGLQAWRPEIHAMINDHHKVTSIQDAPLAEIFRQADWCDVSLGWRRFSIPATVVRDVQHAFPNLGFHRRLVELGLKQCLREPFRPLPMFRW